MTDAELIIALGNITKVAVALGKPKSTVANWHSRGIPWRYRGTFERIAWKANIALPADFLERRR